MEPILDKLKEHDEQFVVIQDKLKEHDEQFVVIGRKLEDVNAHLDRVDEHIVLHTERLDRIEENMATKTDIERITTTLDEIVGLARKKDQELVFMSDRVSHIEKDVERMKPIVGLT